MYAHVGQENYVNIDHVYAIIRNRGATPKKLRNLAEQEHRLYSLTGGEATRSLLVMDNGLIMTSCVTARTLKERLNAAQHELQLQAFAAAESRQGAEPNGDNDDYYLDDEYAPVQDDEELDDAEL